MRLYTQQLDEAANFQFGSKFCRRQK